MAATLATYSLSDLILQYFANTIVLLSRGSNKRYCLSVCLLNAQEPRKAEESGLYKKCVDHIIKLEDDYWNKDGIMDDLC